MNEHACVLSRLLPGGVRECACGERWIALPRAWADQLFVCAELRTRLRDYRIGIEFGRYADLADAVRSQIVTARDAREDEQRTAKLDWIAAKARKARKYWQCVRPLILASGPCAYCGGPGPDCVDHVIPKCQGGSGKIRNLAPACGRCNAQKRGLTPRQWREKRIAAGLPWPPVWANAA